MNRDELNKRRDLFAHNYANEQWKREAHTLIILNDAAKSGFDRAVEILMPEIEAIKYQGEMALKVLDRKRLQEIQSLTAKLSKAKEALESISKNGCCEPCQEAKLVALSALNQIEKKGTDES